MPGTPFGVSDACNRDALRVDFIRIGYPGTGKRQHLNARRVWIVFQHSRENGDVPARTERH